MSSRYTICGWIRARKCAAVRSISLETAPRSLWPGLSKVEVTDVELDQLENRSVEGGSLFPRGYVLEIEELLGSLGPFASEGAVFSGDCDGQPWEVVVAPSARSRQRCA